jgi:hypothetical protein
MHVCTFKQTNCVGDVPDSEKLVALLTLQAVSTAGTSHVTCSGSNRQRVNIFEFNFDHLLLLVLTLHSTALRAGNFLR